MKEEELFRKKNVNGVSWDDGKKECRVYVKEKESISVLNEKDKVPEKIEDYTTDVIEIGEITPIEPKNERTKRYETLRPGISIGHWLYTTAGTLGAFVKKNGDLYILTNSHVCAGSNNASIGSEVLQPGPYDSGKLSEDVIGKLKKFEKMEEGMRWDAGITKQTKRESNFVPIGLEYAPQKVQSPQIGDKVKTTGRTEPNISGSKLLDKDVNIQVNYGDEIGTILIKNTNMYKHFIDGGDSGSGIFKTHGKILCDIAFAGSDKRSFGIGNIEKLFEKYQISLPEEDGRGGNDDGDNGNGNEEGETWFELLLEFLRKLLGF